MLCEICCHTLLFVRMVFAVALVKQRAGQAAEGSLCMEHELVCLSYEKIYHLYC